MVVARALSVRLIAALCLVGCAGSGPDADLPPPEGLAIVELQAGFVGAGGPWLEIANLGGDPVAVQGVVVEVGTAELVLEGPDLEAGAAIVVGTDAAEASGIPVDAIFDDLAIDAAGTVLSLVSGDAVLATVSLDASWPSPVGASLGMEPGWADPTDPTGWCDQRRVGPAGDFGTPGAPNDRCDCAMPFAFRYASASGPGSDVTGEATIALHRDGTYTVEGESGTYTRWTDATGQHVEWVYPTTGIAYSGTRPLGTGPYADQPIAIPAEIPGFTSGTWSADGLCE